MAIKIYVISEPAAIDFIEYGDLDGFAELLAEDDTLIFHDPEIFDTEEEAVAFTCGVGYGLDERAPASRAILRSDIEDDLPFIEVIENY